MKTKSTLKLLFISIVIITLVSAFKIYYTSGCPYHSGSPADGLTCASCHAGGIVTPTVNLVFNPALESGNKFIPGTTYTISVFGSGYFFYGFDLEILNSQSTIASNVLDFGTLNSVSISETINTPSPGYTYSDIMHTSPKSTPFVFEWIAPLNGTGYLYCALLGVNNNGSTSGDKSCVTSMTLSSSLNNAVIENSNLFPIVIYPNPACNQININYDLNENKNLTFELFDCVGKKIMDLSKNDNFLNSIQFNKPFELPSGTYYLKITSASNSTFKKIIFF